MGKQRWDTVEVFEDGYIYWDGFPMEVGDCCHQSESQTGLAYELRHTPGIGRHIVAFSSAEDPDSFIYLVRCNKAGKYFLGPEYGYRKKEEDEEGCPTRRALRHWGLSVDKLRFCGCSVLVRRSDPDLEVRRGGRQYLYVTDAEEIEESDRRFCRISDVLRDFSYIIEVSEETITHKGKSDLKLIWIEHVRINQEDADKGAEEAAKQIDCIMEANEKVKEILNHA